jgi:hypothetical protein
MDGYGEAAPPLQTGVTGVKLTSAATGATIAVNAGATGWTAATLTVTGTNPAITRNAGNGNNLTIGENTTILLNGTDSDTAVGKILLTQDTDAGKLTPAAATSVIYLLNILEYIGKIQKYTKEINSPEELYEINDQLNFNDSISLLANIGENVSRISGELKAEYSNRLVRQPG